ncbi:MAG: ribonuclease Y [Clostridia bacterium]|nr:ribonuclease Y [Clostridia bacterium]
MTLLIGACGVIALLVIAYLLGMSTRKRFAEKTIGGAEKHAEEIVDKAKKDAEQAKKESLIEAKEECLKMKNKAEEEVRQMKHEVQEEQKRIASKEQSLEDRKASLERKEQSLDDKKAQLEKNNEELKAVIEEEKTKLEKLSGLTAEEAKTYLLNSVKEDIKHEMSAMIREEEMKAKDEASKKAKDIIVNAMQRCSVEYVSEATVSVVQLPSDDMKGRIIGREGRNIRAIEAATGIDLIIDDTPDAVILSGFDPIRRETAKIALERLINDGRIHPTKIEEAVEKAKAEIEENIKEEGKKAIYELGVNIVEPELIKLLGKLRYRTSYGQNVLKHSIEVAYLAGLMANELGENSLLAKRAGLLHDIGKSIDYEREGTHVEIGVEICKKYKENDTVVNAVASHHGDTEPTSIISVLVQIADAISAARPGARKETLETYVKRLQQLEDIAKSQQGVDKVFAIQAGREVRILVVPEVINDDNMPILAREVAKKIEESVEYPGQIKVNVVRETRAVELAK